MMWTWWMSLLAVAAVLAAVACIPVGVDARYDAQGLYLAIRVWMLSIRLLPARRKRKPKKAKPAQKPQPQTKPTTQKTRLVGSVEQLMQLLKLAADTLGDLRRKLRVEALTLRVCVPGAEDPAKAAIAYGRAWAAIGALDGLLARIFVIKKRDIQPSLDYNTTTTQVQARLVTTITIGRSLSLALRAAIGFLRIYRQKAKKAV